jgi:general secretion pathway protein A
MYKNFFGFKERPFKLVPNPAYFFLSRGHEEALAHLSYAISQGDGFVEITGEVGTGKTTLCRVFLENLDKNAEAAYIFNPKLDSVQLLKTINDEFGIPSDADNTKDLIDTLNLFLIKKKGEGKKVIILIDEAQNLNKEVLEQLRLLSNLETSSDKLLQIILVGQPELGEMLDSYELRQLGQRITLSCHLSPLTYAETKEYIQHRINIASRKTGLQFNRSAVKSIYKYSGGIPRLINIACDRALLTAYGLNRYKITVNIAKASIRELTERGRGKRHYIRNKMKAILVFLFFGIIVSTFILYRYETGGNNVTYHLLNKEASATFHPIRTENNDFQQSMSEKDQSLNPYQQTVQPATIANPVKNLTDFLKEIDFHTSRRSAMACAIHMWHDKAEIHPFWDNTEDDQDFFQIVAKQNGLMILRTESDLCLIKNLNLPAILELYPPGESTPAYLTLIEMKGDDQIILSDGKAGTMVPVSPSELESYWSGVAYIPWKNFFGYPDKINLSSNDDAIIALKMLMHDLGYKEIEISPFYDLKTQKAVKTIQEKNGIPVDAVVGPLTKIVLYNEKKSLKVPHITSE